MNLILTKKIRRKLEQGGLNINEYLVLSSLFNNEEIWEEDDEKYYLVIQDLIIKGYIRESFSSDEEFLFYLTQKGKDIITQLIENE